MLLDHYLNTLKNFEEFSVYKHNTVFQWAAQATEYSDFYVFCTVYCDIIMQHEQMKFSLFQLIL